MKLLVVVALSCALAGAVASAQHLDQLAAREFFKTAWNNQDQYAEISVLKDAATMLAYARNGQFQNVVVKPAAGTADAKGYQISIGEKTVAVTLPGSQPLWEPARYEAAVGQIAQAIGLERPAIQPVAPRNLLQELEAPSVEKLVAVSLNLSAGLKMHMLESALHDRAALLVGAFGLRERLEPVEDVRWPLNRIAAHLAIAHWLNGGRSSLDGRYALATAYALMNLQTNALGRLRVLEKEQGNVHWNRALYTRITGDWRKLAALPTNELSRLEWAEWIYADSRYNGDKRAAKDVSRFIKCFGEKELDADVFFCVFQGDGPSSVGLGRAVYLNAALPLALSEVAGAWRAQHGSDWRVNNADQLADRLNVEGEGCVHSDGHIDVLDWGAWAMSSQRRLGIIHSRLLEFVADHWGLPQEEVKQTQTQLERVVAKLWLVPCIRAQSGTSEQLLAAHHLFVTRPQVIPVLSLMGLVQCWSRGQPEGLYGIDTNRFSVPAYYYWIGGAPSGTLVNPSAYAQMFARNPKFSQVLYEAPFNITIARLYMSQNPQACAEARQQLKEMADYSTFAGAWIANGLPETDLAGKEAAYLKIAPLDADYYRTLCRLFQKSDMAKAARYFDQARAGEADPVGLSNDAEPFVAYYLSVSNRAKAKEIAQEAEEVGSARGFEAMQTYCIKTHDFRRGLKSAQDEAERYERDAAAVLLYIQRVKTEAPGYKDLDELYAKQLATVFPAGRIHYQPTLEPPRLGVVVNQTSRSLKMGDVIVALDGTAVQTVVQLRALRHEFSWRTGEEDQIPMTVYRYGRYLEVKDTTAYLRVGEFKASALQAGEPLVGRTAQLMGAQPAVAGDPPPPYLSGLRLNGISGTASRRLAMINGKTVAAGEAASLKLNGHDVTVRCMGIDESSASFTVEGVSGQLTLTLK